MCLDEYRETTSMLRRLELVASVAWLWRTQGLQGRETQWFSVAGLLLTIHCLDNKLEETFWSKSITVADGDQSDHASQPKTYENSW